MAHSPSHHEHHTGHTPEMHDRPDEWHRHTTAEERPQHAHAEIGDPRQILGVGLAAFLIVVVSTIAIYFYYTTYTTRALREAENTGLEAGIIAARTTAMEQQRRGYVWVNPDAGVFLLPLDAARQNVINEYAPRLERPR